MKTWPRCLLLYFLLRFNTAISQSLITTLPGYPGNLPFKLETGYIGVGENNDVQLFYYFIESENDPQKDPLVLWITGVAVLLWFFRSRLRNRSPLAFNLLDVDGSFPSFSLNPYSWTKIANIIFIDSPAGTGFSYVNTSDDHYTSDTKSAKDNYKFLQKWLSIHPTFNKNRLYIAGDSYGGKITPMVAVEIAKAGFQPQMLLQGYSVGNARTDGNKDENEKIPYAHRMALISDEYFELVKSSCHGEYVNPDPNNIQCLYALQLVKQSAQSYNYLSSYIWANNRTVQEALHIREGTITDWKRCNKGLNYKEDVESVLKHHQLLSEKGFQTLAYSRDHDMSVSYMSTLRWIHELNLTVDEAWRPWTAGGQVAGYTEKYKNDQAYLTFATVKGAGHTAPEYKPKECLAMFETWLSSHPL
ncbi:hypothetical protein OROGR_031432 [Orobanche gracilis]